MRWIKRAADAVNTNYDVATSLRMALDPSIRRVRKLDQRGVQANGVLTGILFSVRNETTRKEFAISVLRDGAWHRIGVRTQPPEAHRLRLGVPVVVKLDGDRGILDWEAMADAWGLTGQFLAQESMREPPGDGVVDRALTGPAHRHLKSPDRTPATIVSMERLTVMGMRTLNWDIQLRLPTGETTVSKSDEVPSYVQWYAAPGAVVPVVVHPKRPSEATVDWAAFANAQRGPVGFDDDPPPGSIAAEVEASRGAGAATAMSFSPPAPPPPPPPGAPVTLDGTMRSWVAMTRDGHMSRKDLDRALNDWLAAGMCNQAQVDAARAQAGG